MHVTIASAPIAGRPVGSIRTTSPNTPFFIFGCPRSGTSLLSRMLGAHPNLAIPDESHLYNNVYPLVARYGDLRLARVRARLVSQILKTEHIKTWTPAPSVTDTLSRLEKNDFHGIVDGLLRGWAALVGKARWGEKTPQHTLCWRTILSGFPNAQVVHLVRDGRDVMLSYRSAFFGPKHVYPLALRWRQYLSAAEEARTALGEARFLQVRYEDLVRAPERELRRICAFLDEEFTTDTLNFYRQRRAVSPDCRNSEGLLQPVMSDNTGKWRANMTPRELRIFEALAGDCLERLDYERTQPAPSISRWESLSCRYFEHPPRHLSSMLRNQQAHRMVVQRLRLGLSLIVRN
jgi:hypothetical protein